MIPICINTVDPCTTVDLTCLIKNSCVCDEIVAFPGQTCNAVNVPADHKLVCETDTVVKSTTCGCKEGDNATYKSAEFGDLCETKGTVIKKCTEIQDICEIIANDCIIASVGCVCDGVVAVTGQICQEVIGE